MTQHRKLIEVALPLEAINKASAREKSIRHGHPSTLHLWWARRPLAACRAVIFASIVDDPSSHPEQFPTEAEQDAERQRLFRLIEELVRWESTNNEDVLGRARAEIVKATGGNPPPLLDPFAGGGSIPLEAQRLGLEAHASDLNPVAVLINKALIEIPPKFAACPPVHPGQDKQLVNRAWKGAEGLAEDVRYYGQWMRDEADKQIGHLYPKVRLPNEYGSTESKVIAWIWAHTVRCPNPACGAIMPLVRTFALSSKKESQAWVEPVVERHSGAPKVSFDVHVGKGKAPAGTVSRRGASCICCGSPVSLDYVRAEGRAGRMSTQLMAIVADTPHGRVYLPPTLDQERTAHQVNVQDVLGTALPEQALGFRVQLYGMTKHSDLYTARQLLTLDVFSELARAVRERVHRDAVAKGMADDGVTLDGDGRGAAAYADAIATYMALTASKAARFLTVLSFWRADEGKLSRAYGRQTVSMTWDFAETNPFSASGGDLEGLAEGTAAAIERSSGTTPAFVVAQDASSAIFAARPSMVSTDPPYYDNVPYADLSDIFYVWLRRSLLPVYPSLLATILTPKGPELVATPFRFGGDNERARAFFEEGLRRAFAHVRRSQDPAYPATVYYAFKQAESDDDLGDEDVRIASTGWESMLAGLLDAGLQITGTWPMRTEGPTRLRGMGSNALASSIVLVCRPRPDDASLTTRRDFLRSLGRELPAALRDLQRGNIAPVDLAQASIGPGMAIFSRYKRVLEADGSAMTVRTALALINQSLDAYLAEQEGEYDADTRWALAWFEQFGFDEGPFGDAETLSKAKNTSVAGMVDAGILAARSGKVRLLRREELPANWEPGTDRRLTVWEVTQQLIRRMQEKGEPAAAALLAQVGGLGEAARDLAYRLYTICERKGWAQEALPYNGLVVAWSEVGRIQDAAFAHAPEQGRLF